MSTAEAAPDTAPDAEAGPPPEAEGAEEPQEAGAPAGSSAAEDAPDDDAPAEAAPDGRGRVMTGTAWAVLLLALWLFGRDVTAEGAAPALGDVSSAGRSLGAEDTALPAAHGPAADTSHPVRVDIDALGVRAPVTPHDLDARGGVAAPSFAQAGRVGWYRHGPAPGQAGAALLVGHVDTDRGRAAFYALSAAKPGTKVRVTRADGSVAEFTVEDKAVVRREDFDAARVYGARHAGRAELRLLTCGGEFDRAKGVYEANVVVSAYLTAVHAAGTGKAA